MRDTAANPYAVYRVPGESVELRVAREEMLAASRRLEELCVPWRFRAWWRAREAWFVAYAHHHRVAVAVGITPSPMARWVRRGLAKRGLLDG